MTEVDIIAGSFCFLNTGQKLIIDKLFYFIDRYKIRCINLLEN